MSDAKRAARRTFRASDGRWYRQWREPGSRRVFKQLEHRWVWEMEHGPISPGFHVHHINRDRCDNRLENLELLAAGVHRGLHGREREDHQIIDGIEHRSCQRCRVYKPLGDFSRRTAGTFHGYCKPCAAESVRECKARDGGQWRRMYYETVEKPARIAARAKRAG